MFITYDPTQQVKLRPEWSNPWFELDFNKKINLKLTWFDLVDPTSQSIILLTRSKQGLAFLNPKTTLFWLKKTN